MRKVLLMGAAAVVGLGISSANATVTIDAIITKTKTITVTETLDVTKDVFLDVFVDSVPDKFAESVALINQTNDNSEGCGNCAEKIDSIRGSANRNGSGNNNSGILALNVASGNFMNQANSISAAVDARTVGGGGPDGQQVEDGIGFAESMAAAEQRNNDSLVRTVDLLFRDGEIVDSLNGNDGVIFVNVGPGNMGNQANALSLAVSFADEGVALSEADLGQWNQRNVVRESDSLGGNGVDGCAGGGVDCGFGINKSALVQNSINGNAGIVGVNVSSGNFANQANITSFSAAEIGGI